MKKNNFLLFVFPTLIILVNFIAIIFGYLSFDGITLYAKTTVVLALLFWLPAFNIIINFFIVVYGLSQLKASLYSKLSLILSLFLWIPALNIFTSILAIIYGILAIRSKEPGKSLAIAGISIGFITLSLALMGVLLNPGLYFNAL